MSGAATAETLRDDLQLAHLQLGAAHEQIDELRARVTVLERDLDNARGELLAFRTGLKPITDRGGIATVAVCASCEAQTTHEIRGHYVCPFCRPREDTRT